MNEPHDTLWFWAEGNSVRWWCAADSGRVPAHTPLPDPAGLEQIRTLLQHGDLTLRLCPDLPGAWQALDWEGLNLGGKPLAGRVGVARLAPRKPVPESLPDTPRCALIDFWPASEAAQPFRGLGRTWARVYRGAAGQAFATRGTWTELSALVLIGHGGASGGEPLRDHLGRPWRLPRSRDLPPLVVLLACGEAAGSAHAAASLLAAGAQTVLAATGELSALAAASFLADLLEGWQAGQSVAQILRRAQGTADALHGALRLRLFGHPDLRVAPERGPAERPTSWLADQVRNTLADGAEPRLVRELLQRLTLESWQTAGETWPDLVLQRLRGALDLNPDWGDKLQARSLLASLDQLADRLPPMTQVWVLALATYLAEVHDHGLLPRLEVKRGRLDQRAKDAPVLRYHWSKLYYRDGRYGQAAKEIAAGLARLGPDSPGGSTGAGLLGVMLNILLDLDLPEPAALMLTELDHYLASLDGPDLPFQRHNLLDRKARLALRQGKPAVAASLFQRKREQSQALGRDTRRELAWLLYVEGWRDPGGDPARALAQEVGTALADLDRLPLGPGNEHRAYLLRALALWTWRAGDTASAADMQRQHLALLRQRLASQDPGPFGMAIAFLRLGGETPSLTAPWSEATAVLEHLEYWLELAALHALSGETEAAAGCLQQFQRRRQQLLPTLQNMPPWAWGGYVPDWEQLLKDRSNRERAALAVPVDPARLVASGVLPL